MALSAKPPDHFTVNIRKLSTGSMVQVTGPSSENLTGIVAWPFDYQDEQEREANIVELSVRVGIGRHLPVFLFESVNVVSSDFYPIAYIDIEPKGQKVQNNWVWVATSRIRKITPLGELHYKDLCSWPAYLKVMLGKQCETDGVYFAPGTAGKLLKALPSQEDENSRHLDISWNFQNTKFRKERYPYIELDAQKVEVKKHYGPYENVWTILDSGNLFLMVSALKSKVFPDRLFWGRQRETYSAPFELGAYVLLRSKEGPKVLARIVNKSNTAYVVQYTGRCSETLLGHSRTVPFSEAIEKYEYTAVTPMQKVEITADLSWRGQNLKGLAGVVLTHIDEEDEVGVELQKKVGGGSLDGQGASGHCLFIPVKALKIRQ